MTGVAVTAPNNSSSANDHIAVLARVAGCLVAGCLVAAAFTVATAGTVYAQAVVPSGAPASPAPAAGAASVQQIPAPAGSPPPPAGLVLPPQPPPPALGAPPTEQRGFLNGFGKWWNQSIADWKAKMKEQQTKVDEFNKQSADAAKDAATATQQAMKNAANVMRLSHVIEIQQACPVAGNGAADCATAATNACKTKGYSSGQPLDVRTAEKCADSLWVSGQNPTAADCPEQTVLLRAACQ
jgi:hypothetical protein